MPMTFSPLINERVSAAKRHRLQKVWTESQSPFIGELVDVRDMTELLDVLEKHVETMDLVETLEAIDVLFAIVKNEQ